MSTKKQPDNNVEPIRTLEEAVDFIRILVERLDQQGVELGHLRTENAKLRDEIARLKKNSSTSSKPPSSDITKPKSEQRQPGKRKRGGQPGHKGAWRMNVEPDEVRELHLDCCPECGSGFLGAEDDNIKILQQAELVVKPVEVVEYRQHGRYCQCCGVVQYPSLPEGVIPGQVLGPQLLSLCGYMKSTMGVSISDIKAFFDDVLGCPIARSTVQNSIFRVSAALAQSHEEVLKELPKQQSLNIDETGWKDNGQRHWVWAFCTKLIACFVIRDSRGCKVLRDILGETFDGALTSDFYSAYVCYATTIQQFCLAHLIRDIKFLTTLPSLEAKDFGHKILEYMREIFTLWHQRKDHTPEQFEKRATDIKTSLGTYISTLEFVKGSDPNRILKRMLKHWDSIFRFIKYPTLLEPTNNSAERAQRNLVRLRRGSQGSRGTSGQQWNARAATVVASCRLQQRNPWHFIQAAVLAHFFHFSAPTLVVKA